MKSLASSLVLLLPAIASAQPAEPPAPPSSAAPAGQPAPPPPPPAATAPPAPGPTLTEAEPRLAGAPVQIHGFVSEGAFVSTANDFIGHSSRGSLEFFQAAVNVSSELTDQLHVGAQLFSQDEGRSNDLTPRLDWAFLDYRWRPQLGARIGRVRIPFGLYNDYIDIDAARLQILLPQSIYPITDRNILTAQNGFTLYGTVKRKAFGSLDYQVYAGVLTLPLPGPQDANNTRIYAYDSKYVAGGQLFWHPPLDGLRVGGSYLRTSLDYYLNLSPALTSMLIASGAAPATFDGNLLLSIRPANLWIASSEYVRGDWLFAAEYSRWITHSRSTPVSLIPYPISESERFYGLVTYRLTEQIDCGVYYSVLYAAVDDRDGSKLKPPAQSYYAWSRDAAASLRYDVNDHWLWKVEAHLIDGAAALNTQTGPLPSSRYWGLFLLRTTVTF